MAGAPSWDDTTPVAAGGAPSWDDTSPIDDHGLAERQKLSPVGKALSPITGYWPTQKQISGEAMQQMRQGVGQIMHPGSLSTLEGTGLSDILTGVGNVAAGGLGYVTSPAQSLVRSVASQPLEDVTGLPREYTE